MSWHLQPHIGQQPHKVRMKRDVFYDTERDRNVPYKLYYPQDGEQDTYPLIIWSHGLGGSRDGAGFLARYIASHGYMLLHLSHHGTDSSLWEGKPGHPWDAIRAAHISRKVTIARFLDIPFVLDCIESGEGIDQEFLNMIDTDRIGMSGHSFGAITTQVIAGQKLGRGRRRYSLRDDRIKAAIAYSMSPTYNHDDDHNEIYGSINVPMLFMTGTEDSSPVSGKGYEYRLPIYECSQGPDQHLLVLEEGDHMVFAGSRGQLGETDLREVHEEIIKTLSHAFWDAYLKEDVKAYEWLAENGAVDYLDERATLQNKNLKILTDADQRKTM